MSLSRPVPLWSLALLILSGCAIQRAVLDEVERTEDVLLQAQKVYASLCAPDPMANAQAHLDFTRVELHQGDIQRASQHSGKAYTYALEALQVATPCGTLDSDGDGIPDVVDRCPHEPEDFDGVQDEDGCRDIDPYGDDDGDGIINMYDACIDEPENFNGYQDEDGCPETEDDRDGDGIPDIFDACPNESEDKDGFQDEDGCPDPDNDGDGVPDVLDRCPLDPEDFDGWEDADGCPDPDNDGDGIPDIFDHCPNAPGDRSRNGCPTSDRDGDGIPDEIDQCPDEPETFNNYQDEDGCPDQAPTMVRVTKTQVEIKETIQFETGSAKLLPVSFDVLNEVVLVLKDNPDMRLRVEGHTDSQGGEALNQRLSEERAASVRTYLESKGIANNRLQSAGFGLTRPIDTNRTAEGRARNRRVEFHIVGAEE